MEGLKKLFQVKRILAMVLAVTLAVTSAPLTAQAAPEDIPAQTEATVEDTSTGETPAEETSKEETSKTEEASTEGTSGEDVSLEETKGESTAGDKTADADESVEEDADKAEESVPDAQSAAQEVPTAEIRLSGLNNLVNAVSNVTVNWSEEDQTGTVTKVYSDEDSNPFQTVVNELQSGQYIVIEGVGIGAETGDEYNADTLKGQLKYTWKQKDGTDMPGASAPVDAGEYRLEISIDAELVKAEPKSIDFVIEKAKLYVKPDSTKLPDGFSGKTAAEVKKAYAEAMQIALGTSEETAVPDERYLQFVTASDVSVITVSTPLGGALGDTDILKKDGDYLVEIAPALKEAYAKNYELFQYAKNIAITELIPVHLETESTLAPGKDITYVYKDTVKSPIDTTADADKKVTVKIVVPGETDETTGKAKELTAVLDGDKKNITGAWLDADKTALGEEKVPENAGVYYYKLIYTDPDGVYGVDPKAEYLVKVVVEPAKLAVKPKLADDKKEYQKGTEVSDLLKNVEYDLMGRGADGKYTTPFEIPAEEKDTFWGVSYNNPGKPQYYEPVFQVEKNVTTTTTYTAAGQKATVSETGWKKVTSLIEASGETEDKANSNASQTVKKKVEYRVAFAGQKGLYKNGVASDPVDINKQIDINSANKNYDVDVTKEVMGDAANVVAITVSDSTEVTIDTADIVANIKDMTLKDGVYTKEYNEKAPFADRSEYKKAKTNEAKADEAGSFTYEWYNYVMTDKLDEKGEPVKDSAGNPVQEPKCGTDRVATDNDYTLTTLANAKLPNGDKAEYCLKISYTDPTKTYTAKPAYLFFKIEGKRVKVKDIGKDLKPKAYTNGTVSEFLAEIGKTIDYSIFEVNADGSENDLTAALKEIDQKINEENKDSHLYRLGWVVLKGDNVDPAKAKYTKAGSNETFEQGVPYKLGVELRFENSSNKEYSKYYWNYTNEYERPEADPIQHDWNYDPANIELGVMSDVELKIDFHPEVLTAYDTIYNGEEQFTTKELIEKGYITAAAENAPDTPLAIGNGEGQVPLVFKWEKNQRNNWVSLEEKYANPVNAGEYQLKVSFPGNDKYHKLGEVITEDHFWINARELKVQVTGELKSDLIKAGLDMSDVRNTAKLVDKENLTVTGYIEADKAAFAGNDEGIGLVKDAPAFKDSYNDDLFNILVYEKGKKDKNDLWESRFSGNLRYGKEYELVVDAWLDGSDDSKIPEILKDGYANNYFVSCEGTAFKVTKRGNSTVENVVLPHSDDVSNAKESLTMYVKSSVQDDNKVTVTPVSGICYFYDRGTALNQIPVKEFVPGNYLIFNIVAPAEFDAKSLVTGTDENGDSYTYYIRNYNAAFKNFVYENSIVNDGKGYVLASNSTEGTITVAFPVTKEDQKDARNFTILWEKLNGENYTEEYTVDMSGAKLEDDLRTAVAPKTLAFNGVKTKMTVGETQQLDVKMTKVLNSDVVFLNYEVTAGKEYASVTTETGVVTALKKGKATIQVYPVRRNSKGEVEKVPDFKKIVKTTITISDVTAPKIKSVYAYDTRVEVKYVQPEDGYRREYYVIEGKKAAKEFEPLITSVQEKGKNKLDETFADWGYWDSENPDKTKVVTKFITSGLKPATDYTVYVRNVSGVRTLDDGSAVALSGLGSVKTFKTTKAQLTGIRLDYKTADEKAKLTPASEKLYNSKIDEIDLSKGSVQLQALGEFSMKPEKDAADTVDHEWKPLPLNKNDAAYETQKLTYYAVESTNGYTKEYITQNKLEGYKTLIGDYYYRPSSIAKIDKKGKLTLKGVGVVYIIAYDSVSKKSTPASSVNTNNIDKSLEVSKSYHYALRITSGITGIKAKDITLKTGSHVSVRPSLTFMNGNKKLAVGANDTSIPIIIKSADSKAVEIVGDYVVAKEPDQTVELTVCLRDDPKVEGKLKVKTKKMDPVKAVKALDVVDDQAYITFTHTGNEIDESWQDSYGNWYSDYMGSEPIKFKIDLLDNRKRLIRSHIDECDIVWNKSNQKKGVYFYQYQITGLKRQSVYNVTVTPVYGNQEMAKASGSKFTTTNIPASKASVGKDANGNLLEGGMTIGIESTSVTDLKNVGYLTSGNTYTLVANADYTARIRKSDTLTWKSSNSKVASVKANAGSYTATLKAASVGYTYIEVTSKITKKVIARYIVRVKSVSNGGQGAYGDTEPKVNVAWDPLYDQGIEVLTEKNPVRFNAPMGAYDYRWISFTAPADGSYNVYGTNVSISGYYYKSVFPEQYDGGEETSFKSGSYAKLDEGDTIYFKAAGGSKGKVEVYVNGYKQGKLTGSDAVSVAGLTQVTFIAPEDNYYTFYATENGKSANCRIVDEYDNWQSSDTVYFATEADGTPEYAGIGLKKGWKVQLSNLRNHEDDDYSISVKGRTYAGFDASGKASTGGSLADKEGAVKGKWFVFEAKAAGEYTFKISPNKNDAMDAKFFTNLTRKATDSSEFNVVTATVDGKQTISPEREISLNEGDKIAIYVYATTDTEVSADVNVSQPTTASVSLAAATPDLEVKSGAPVWVSFKVPETDKEYCFNYEVETGKNMNEPTYYKDNVTTEASIYNDRFTNNSWDPYKTVYIKLTTDDASAKVKVSVKETAAASLTLGKDADFEVTYENKQFFTITASTAGLYRFETTLAEGSTGNVDIWEVEGAPKQSTSYYSTRVDGEKELLAGQKLTVAVRAQYGSGTVKGKLKVTAVTVDPLEAKEYELAAGETRYFKFTPNKVGKYMIAYNAGTATWGKSLGEVTNYNFSYPIDMSAGEVVYVKVQNPSSTEKLKTTFTITSMGEPLPKDGKITVKADTPAEYKYVVKQTGMYKLTYTSDPADANPSVTYGYSRTGISSGEEISCPAAGATLTFNVSVVKNATVTLNMQRIEPNTTLEATVAKDGVQWFEFTAPKTGRYTLALANDAGKAVAAGVTAQEVWGRITDEPAEDSFDATPDDPWSVWFEKDQKWYCRVANGSGAEQKVKLLIAPITASEALVVGADPKAPTFSENEKKWYSLEIKKDTFYDITLEGAWINLWRDRYDKDSVDDDSIHLQSDAASTINRQLKKGTYLVQAGKYGEAAAKIGIKEVTMLELKEGQDLPVTAASGVTTYINFKPSKTAWYAFRLKDTNGVDSAYASVTASTEDTSNPTQYVNISDTNVYGWCQSKLKAAKENTVTLTLYYNQTSADEKKTVKLSVEEINPAKLVNELPVSVEKGVKSFFTFKAPESGWYDFAADSKDVEVEYGYSYGGSYLPFMSDSSENLPARMYMDKDDERTFAVGYDSLKADSTLEEVPAKADFKVSVKPFKPEALSLNGANTITFSENETEKWYSLKPEKFGNYEWKFTGTAEGGNISVQVYQNSWSDSTWNISLSESEIIKSKELYSHYNYVVKITSQNHPSFQMEVSYVPPVDVTKAIPISIGDGTTSTNVTVSEGDYALYKFTASMNGYYTFYTEGDMDTWGDLYNESLEVLNDGSADDDEGPGSNFKIEEYLNQGAVYYLKVREYYDSNLVNYPLYFVKGRVSFGNPDDDV